MTKDEQLAALLDIIDGGRTQQPGRSERLVVFGLAERRGRGFWPIRAGFNLLGAHGRAIISEAPPA